MGMRRLVTLTVLALALAACGTEPNPGDSVDRQLLTDRTQAAINDFKRADPSIQRFFATAHAYVVFPKIVTAAVGVGGAHGDGEVFEGGKLIGYADVSQGSVGAQLGAQKYGEVLFFENEGSFVDFKQSTMEFDARAGAIAASAGAAAAADYSRGVVTFTLPESGLMAQAAIGGQKFRYEPVGK
jgi:lipid-binding SYLF domain-containing protein